MIALFFLVIPFLFGTSLLRRTSLRLHLFELIPAGFLVGAFSSTWIVFLLSMFIGIPRAAGATLFILFALTLFLAHGKKTPLHLPQLSRVQCVIFVLFTILWSALFLPLFISHNLEKKADGLYSGGGAWGDIALHATFIEKFAAQTKLDITSPIYSTEKSTYPFLFDYYAALLMRYGFSIQAAMVVSGFSFTLIFLQLCYWFIVRLTKSHMAAVLCTLLFFFNGGLGVWYAYQDWISGGLPLLGFLASMKVEYAHLADVGIQWSNIIADYMLPQRAFVSGLPMFMLIVVVLRSIWLAKEDHPDQRLLLATLIGMLPLFHTHTFLTCMGLLVWFIAADCVIHKRKPTAWILPLLVVVLLAGPQMWWQSHTVGKGFMRIELGWMKGDESIIPFWIRNMGIEILFFVFGGIYFFFFEKKQKFLKLLFFPLAILFIITNIIVFQPHNYDNMKLMIYSHFGIVAIMTVLLLQLWRRHILGKLLCLVLILGITITGILSVWRESYTSWQIATTGDLQMADAIKHLTSPYAIFLTADRHNHPVTMLAGRSMVMGYRGWLWTHGIDYSQTEKDVSAMLTGESDTPILLAQYHVSYVYIGSSEIDSFHADDSYYRDRYPVIFQNESGTVYNVQVAPKPVQQLSL